MRWYLHPDGNEFLEWHPGKINKVLAPTTVQRVEPEAAVFLPNGKVLAPLTDAGASPPAGKVVDERSVAFDAEAGTATAGYTYRDATAGEVALAFSARKVQMLAAVDAAFKAKRSGGTSITVGQATIPVATIHDAVVELTRAKVVMGAEGSMGVVNRAKIPVTLTPAGADAMLAAIDAHVAACQQTEHDLYVAIAAAENNAALDLVDIDAGTVDGEGGWPANG